MQKRVKVFRRAPVLAPVIDDIQALLRAICHYCLLTTCRSPIVFSEPLVGLVAGEQYALGLLPSGVEVSRHAG
jgi:hypothetical protein